MKKTSTYVGILSVIIVVLGVLVGCQKKITSIDSVTSKPADADREVKKEIKVEPLNVQFPFYEIKKNGELEGYLLGAIHAGNAKMYPFPDELMEKANQSNVIVTEIDTSGADQTKEKFYQENQFISGKELIARMSPKTEKRFKELLNEVGLTVENIENQNMVEITYAIERKQEKLSLAEVGLAYNFGVERMVQNNLSNTYRKAALETLEERYNVLYSPFKELSVEDWITDFYTLAESTEELKKTYDNYVIGNMEENTFAYRERFPEKFSRLVDGRNQIWLPKMTQLMSEESTLPLFMVGVGHFYGDGGLLTILEKSGYTVEPIEFIKK